MFIVLPYPWVELRNHFFYVPFAEDKKLTCADIKCPPAKICVLDKAGQPSCRCLVECSKKIGTGPVCGKNGIEYQDLCDLKNEECKNGDYILVKKYGGCSQEGE